MYVKHTFSNRMPSSRCGGRSPGYEVSRRAARGAPWAMSKHVSIPVKVLHDAEGHTVTVELKTGEVFRGKLDEAEDNMNLHISNCTKTAKDGRVSTLASVFLRGSHVRFMVLPDILKNAPFFKKIETKQAKQAQAKSGNKSQQAAQQRASGRRDVGLPEKQKMRDARKNPNFS